MINIDMQRFRPLREGAAASAYTLPAEILAGFEEVDRLEQYQAQQYELAAPAARDWRKRSQRRPAPAGRSRPASPT